MYFPSSRLFVAGNPKAAGTSLRWWLLTAHGVDVPERTAQSMWGESAPFQVVWDGELDLDFTWNDLSPEERTEALTDDEVLTVQPVRHPVSRAFSAWAGKYLTLEPYYNDRLPAAFAVPSGEIDSADQITSLFETFVATLAGHLQLAASWNEIDVHFWPQHRLLGRQPVGPVLLLRQENMQSGLDRIVTHLGTHGLNAPPMPRFNENVVPYRRELVSDRAVELIHEIYGGDFAAWDYDPAPPASSRQELDLPWLNDVRGRNRRYGVVHAAAMWERQRTSDLTAERDRLRRELQAARQREHELLTSHSWRVTQPLRWASRLTRPKSS